MVNAARENDLRVAVVAVEICSAAFYLEDDPGVLISACIFSDGAAATLWSGQPGKFNLSTHSFDTHHVPEDREFLRFLNSGGKLKNRLHRSVPGRAARAVQTLWDRQPAQPNPPRVVAHSGGRDVLDALEGVFPEQDLAASRSILRQYGNMSSPSVLFALEEILKENPGAPDQADDFWLVAFGAGFSAHSCRLSKPT
jgi:alkylresorcinol/alkylpyrone synthase